MQCPQVLLPIIRLPHVDCFYCCQGVYNPQLGYLSAAKFLAGFRFPAVGCTQQPRQRVFVLLCTPLASHTAGHLAPCVLAEMHTGVTVSPFKPPADWGRGHLLCPGKRESFTAWGPECSRPSWALPEMQEHPRVWSSPARTTLPGINQSAISCCLSGIPGAWTLENSLGAGVSLLSQPGTSKCHLLGLSFQARPRLDDGRAEIKGLSCAALVTSPAKPLHPCQSKGSRPSSFFSSRRTWGDKQACFLFPVRTRVCQLWVLEHSLHFNSANSGLARPHAAPREQGSTTGWCWPQEAMS